MPKSHFTINKLKEKQRRGSKVKGIGVILVAQLLFCSFMSVSAQSEVSFTSKDTFRIPTKNSSIRFAINGTYETATLLDGVWTFHNLYLVNSRGIDKLNLTISAADCDLTVYP